jgi:hypothetical protein
MQRTMYDIFSVGSIQAVGGQNLQHCSFRNHQINRAGSVNGRVHAKNDMAVMWLAASGDSASNASNSSWALNLVAATPSERPLYGLAGRSQQTETSAWCI